MAAGRGGPRGVGRHLLQLEFRRRAALRVRAVHRSAIGGEPAFERGGGAGHRDLDRAALQCHVRRKLRASIDEGERPTQRAAVAHDPDLHAKVGALHRQRALPDSGEVLRVNRGDDDSHEHRHRQ